jgi:hypothetical protein
MTAYHVVSQIDTDSWLVRVKRPCDVLNCDDLVLRSDVELLVSLLRESKREYYSEAGISWNARVDAALAGEREP